MPATAADPARPQRLVSLDLLRGFAVIGMILLVAGIAVFAM